MRVLETLVELVIFAKDRGADDDPDLRAVIRSAEFKIEFLRRERYRRASLRRRSLCLRCECRRTDELLCGACWLDAPPVIQRAFRDATGLEGMRRAAARVKLWAAATGAARNQEEAA